MIAIGLTDLDWFTALHDGPLHREVNFWTPTPWHVSSLGPGDRFYFLLKAPIRKVGGYGHFADYLEMHASEAWDRFGLSNGVTDFTNLVARTMKYVGKRTDRPITDSDPVIGCIVLSQPVFFDEPDFFAPEDRGAPVPREVVKFKTFRELDTLDTFVSQPSPLVPFQLVEAEGTTRRKGLTTLRPRQQQFRYRVMQAYGSACAVTGETCPEVLEAAHIQPFIDDRSNNVRNGLLLRKDLHPLFDAGLITIASDFTIKASPLLTSETYQGLDGVSLRLPSSEEHRPSEAALTFHREWVFREKTSM